MIQSKRFFSRFLRTGPGGYKCACCFTSSSKPRRKAFKVARGKLKRDLEKDVQDL